MSIDIQQNLEIERRGILIAPHTNLENSGGAVGFNGNPNTILRVETTTDAGRELLWALPRGTHYINYNSEEFVKIASPGAADSMAGCWKKISFTDGEVIDKTLYTGYSVLAATTAGNPQPITIESNSVLVRVADTFKSVKLSTNLATDDLTQNILATSQAVVKYVEETIVGGIKYKGGYDIATDTITGGLNLQGSNKPSIVIGDTYVITVSGSFFGITLTVGDMIIANGTTSTAITDWTLVQKAIPDIVDASETAKGIIQIATSAEVAAGTDDTKAVTPLKLKDQLTLLDWNNSYKQYRKTIENTSGTDTIFTIAQAEHGLNKDTLAVIKVIDTSSGQIVEVAQYIDFSTGQVTLKFGKAPTSNRYVCVIYGYKGTP